MLADVEAEGEEYGRKEKGSEVGEDETAGCVSVRICSRRI